MKFIATLRSFIMGLLYLPFLMFMSALCILANILFSQRKIDNAIIQSWGFLSTWWFGVEVELRGAERLPKEGCVFLFNHTSFFDIFAMTRVIPGLRYGAKIELFSIPLFGTAMRRVGILPIARDNLREVIKVYDDAKVRFKAGEQFALAPEGTRQETEKLGPFKAGPFLLALQTQVPVVPVVIRGAAAIMPKGSVFPNSEKWKSRVIVDVLAPIPTLGMSVDQKQELQQKVRAEMELYLREPI